MLSGRYASISPPIDIFFSQSSFWRVSFWADSIDTTPVVWRNSVFFISLIITLHTNQCIVYRVFNPAILCYPCCLPVFSFQSPKRHFVKHDGIVPKYGYSYCQSIIIYYEVSSPTLCCSTSHPELWTVGPGHEWCCQQNPAARRWIVRAGFL